VTDQYLAAIRQGDRFDPQALAEFIAIGAKLMYLKSRALLPRLPDEPVAALEEDEVGRELVEMLAEYRRFREVVELLRRRQDAGLRLYPRLALAPAVPPGPGLERVDLKGLYGLMLELLSRLPPEPRAIIPHDGLTLTQSVTDFRERLRRVGRFSFREAIAACQSRREVIVSFMAILELLKAGECDAVQSAAWGDIEVVAAPAAALARN
jgi:segregation and condensation protein A